MKKNTNLHFLVGHKSGKAWLTRVAESIEKEKGIVISKEMGPKDDYESKKILHLIRDPRDVIVSGYFYHRICKEKWAKNSKYQSLLNLLDKFSGLMVEIHYARGTINKTCTNYNSYPNYMCMKYEDLILNQETNFRKIFEWFGFEGEAVNDLTRIALSCGFEKITGRKLGEESKGSHARKGIPGDWKNHFTEKHKEYFKETYPGVLELLKYEDNDKW